MDKKGFIFLFVVTIFSLSMTGCGKPAAPITMPTSTTAPTDTPEPTSTATLIPSPTPLPGSLVLPVDTLDKNIPWLPAQESGSPGTYYFWFNSLYPPFNNVLVRQAFTAAIDREAIVEIARKYNVNNPRPATTFTPPEILGRDLYNEVGIPFNPELAKELFEQAGYTGTSKFPKVTIYINVAGQAAPGFHVKVIEEMISMWKQTLGVEADYKILQWGPFLDRVSTDPPAIFRLGWAADYNDPDNFLREIFHYGSQSNYGNFLNSDFDQLVDRAQKSHDPVERQLLYIQAERILCEEETAVIPIYHSTY